MPSLHVGDRVRVSSEAVGWDGPRARSQRGQIIAFASDQRLSDFGALRTSERPVARVWLTEAREIMLIRPWDLEAVDVTDEVRT